MKDPLPFLMDRLEEDREVIDDFLDFAQEAPPGGPWVNFGTSVVVQGRDWKGWLPLESPEVRSYLRHWEPKRTHWQQWAVHNIAVLHQETEGHVCGVCVDIIDDRPVPVVYPCDTVRLLAAPYRQHPDFDPEWDNLDWEVE